MPSITPRKKTLNLITQWMAIILILNTHNKTFILLYLSRLHQCLSTTQYLTCQRSHQQCRTRSMYVDALKMLKLPKVNFLNKFCVTQDTFLFILKLIENNALFLPRPSGRPQAPVIIQLAVTIWRMTHEGNGASVAVIARTFGCSGEFTAI
jgi:hypothetical protein